MAATVDHPSSRDRRALLTPRMLCAALRYAALGWAVFPLGVRSKLPMIPKRDGGRGHLDATTDEACIRGWWTRWPRANIGAATGARSGIDVLDVDPKNGGVASLAALLAEHGGLPATLAADSGSGGAHHVLRHADGARRTLGALAGLDYLGDGGYVVVAPSIHPCGRPYRWRRGQLGIAQAPGWLLDALDVMPRPPAPSTGLWSPPLPIGCPGTRYGAAALRRATLSVASATPGTRNHALNAAAWSLARLVAAGHLAAGDVEAHLLDASRRNGYLDEAGETAVRRVIACATAAGLDAGPCGPSVPWARRGVTA